MDVLGICEKIEELLKQGNTIVAIDGKAASGKSTLASDIKNNFNCSIIHMDDYFLPPEKKTPERLAEPGGNVDYERFYDEVISNLNNEYITINKYDCQSNVYTQETVSNDRLLVVEGAYSMRPEFIDKYDMTIFMDISDSDQEKRILERNGKTMLKRFINEWIPLENKYFKHYNTKAKADYILGDKNG